MKRLLLLGCVLTLGAQLNAQGWIFSDATKLGGTVNADVSEESIPVFSKDSSTLYFVRLFDPANKGGETDQDIWFSKRENDGSYSASKPLKSLNNKYNNAIVGMNRSGTSMYLLNSYEGKKDTVKGIAVSMSNGTGWSKPNAVEVPGLVIRGDFYGFHINEDENVILVSYNGPNSLGEEDLYVTTKGESGWSTPVHMGNEINTAGFEISPFLSDSQDTLFFSSNGLGGLGDADIFFSVKGDSWTDWSAPINMGDKINSEKFDAYFIKEGYRGYWSSNRAGERSDIYTIEMMPPPPLMASAVGTDVTMYDGADGKIDLTVDGGVAPYTYMWSNGTTVEDPTGLVAGDYSVMVADAFGQESWVSVTIGQPELELDPVVATIFENFQFKHEFSYNRAKISFSRGDLKKFVKGIREQLEKDERPSITIKVSSSASNVPTKRYGTNQRLAELRAENMKYDIVDYFKRKKLSDRVNVVIVSSVVAGPAYEEDAKNRPKYTPFQFVSMETE